MTDSLNSVQQFSLFAELSPADRASIVSAAHEKSFSRKEIIYSEGNPVKQVIMLLSGCVKVTQRALNGNEVILRLTGPGELLGGLGKATSEHFSSAQTLQKSTALVWETKQFEDLLARLPILRRNIAHALERHLNELEQRFREVSTEKVGSRLSSELLRLSNRHGRPGSGRSEITLSRAELAQLTGLSLFTVSRLLCQWESLGIVKIRREAVTGKKEHSTSRWYETILRWLRRFRWW